MVQESLELLHSLEKIKGDVGCLLMQASNSMCMICLCHRFYRILSNTSMYIMNSTL